jgi:transcription termination/antitermination protein NusG
LVSDEPDEAVHDDAVSNRSDDTMLEEAPHPENGAAVGSSESPAEEQAVAAEAEAEAMSGADVDEADVAESQDEPVTDESIEEVAEEEEKYSGRGAIEEDLSEEEIHMDWYILKVQSNRERSIAEALERKMKI